MNAPRFVVDTMLGRLARWLRAMGYDTLYPVAADDRHLLQVAHAEDRILLTRDAKLARLAGARGCLIRGDQVEQQLVEAREKLALSRRDAGWLSRCLECNAVLGPRARDEVRGVVPEYVFASQAEFMGCPGCGKIYWCGSHADRMLERLRRLFQGGNRREGAQ